MLPVHVVERGAGAPPVVFTHGIGDDHATWAAQIDECTRRHRVVAWDLPGHGESAIPPPEECDRDHTLARLAEVVDRAGPPVVLAGHSLGGYLSLAHTLRRPRDVVGLALVATGPGFRDPQARARWNEYVSQATDWFPDHPHVARMAVQPDAEVIDGLDRITVPALLIVGSRDRRYHDGMAYLGRKLTGARTLAVDGAGHHPQRSHPEVVNPALAEFLEHPRS